MVCVIEILGSKVQSTRFYRALSRYEKIIIGRACLYGDPSYVSEISAVVSFHIGIEHF